MESRPANVNDDLSVMLGAIPDLLFLESGDGRNLAVHVPRWDLVPEGKPGLLGSREGLLGRSLSDLPVSPRLVRERAELIRRALETGELQMHEYVLDVPAGQRTFEARIAPCGGDRVLVIVRDITQRHATGEALRASERRFAALTEISPVGVFQNDAAGRCIYVNARWCEITGYSSGDALGEAWIAAVHPDDREEVVEHWREAVRTGERFRQEFRFVHRDGGTVWVICEAIAQRDENAAITGFVGTTTDITELKRSNERLLHAATVDNLTDVANRALFMDRLRRCILRAKRRESFLYAVLFLDLDRFKAINDTYGHQGGDVVLRDVARRLSSCVRETDTVGRIGGDEFTILLEDIAREDDAIRVARRVLGEFERPFRIGASEVFAGTSIGVALGMPGTADPDEVLRVADSAMYHAKEQGRGRYVLLREEGGECAEVS
ncbi:diguanylate cyclase [Candidatus Poribacteria bacterium]|nr:diguanylate cyclase [Candidatus Poribacteria bacterium]